MTFTGLVILCGGLGTAFLLIGALCSIATEITYIDPESVPLGADLYYDARLRQYRTSLHPKKTGDPTCDYCGQSLYTDHCGAHPKLT